MLSSISMRTSTFGPTGCLGAALLTLFCVGVIGAFLLLVWWYFPR
jgi:hypothetical protein